MCDVGDIMPTSLTALEISLAPILGWVEQGIQVDCFMSGSMQVEPMITRSAEERASHVATAVSRNNRTDSILLSRARRFHGR